MGKIKNNPNLIVFFMFFAMLISCKQETRGVVKGDDVKTRDERLQEINLQLVRADDKVIRHFIDSVGWKMQFKQVGMWYQIIKPGVGYKVSDGQYVSVEYEIKLLNGTSLEKSDLTGVKKFKVGFSNEMAGFQEAVRLISKGGEIRIIIPPHLGKGLMGDMKNIPRRSILVCDIKVIDVEEN